MPNALTHRQRIVNQIHGDPTDRIPCIGGWNLGVRNLAELAGIGVQEYLLDPLAGVVRANVALDVDAMVWPVVPRDVNAIRDGLLEERNFAQVEPEALLERAEAIPDSEAAVLARFDPARHEANQRGWFATLLAHLDPHGIVLVPPLWDATTNFALYFQYGYEAFLSAVALYPEAIGRIYWEDSLLARERNKINARLYRELDLVPLVFTGHDICNNAGPMCSPAFLRQHYWPHVRPAFAPLLEAGIRIIGHCDGNVMPLVDDMLAAGFSGFQGFQYECGVDPYALAAKPTIVGRPPLFFAGLSVTNTLPFGTPADLRAEVDWLADYTDGGRRMFLFTSNVTGVEVPPANVRAAYEHVKEIVPGRPVRPVGAERAWPWARRGGMQKLAAAMAKE